MSRSFRLLFPPALILLSLLSACDRAEPAAGPGSPPPAAVTVVTLNEQALMLTRELPGRISPFQVAEVRPQVTGIVREVLVNEGGRVEAGQPLYQLDDAIYRAEHNSAKAALDRAKVAHEVARVAAERSASLFGKAMVSRQDNDNAIARLRQAEADVAVAGAALATSAVKLAHAALVAPITGTAGKSMVTKGALVTANQDEAMLIIQQLDPVYADLSQSAAELLELRRQLEAGTLDRTDDIPVRILLEDGSEYGHAGRLLFTEATVDPATGSYLLRVEVPNPDRLLMPGMYVRAAITTGKRERAILVPQPGVARDPKGNATAMVVTAEGKAEQRAVQVNRTVGDNWLIDSGLAAGERVIVEGLQRVRPGAPVEMTETRSMEPPAAIDAAAR